MGAEQGRNAQDSSSPKKKRAWMPRPHLYNMQTPPPPPPQNSATLPLVQTPGPPQPIAPPRYQAAFHFLKSPQKGRVANHTATASPPSQRRAIAARQFTRPKGGDMLQAPSPAVSVLSPLWRFLFPAELQDGRTSMNSRLRAASRLAATHLVVPRTS